MWRAKAAHARLADDGLEALAAGDGEQAAATAAAGFSMDVIDVIARARLQPLELDRPAFIQRWQAYLRALQAAVERDHGVERTERLALGAQIFAKKLLREFDELDFFTPPTNSGDGPPPAAAPLAVLGYREDELTPYVYFLKEGVREVRGGANT